MSESDPVSKGSTLGECELFVRKLFVGEAELRILCLNDAISGECEKLLNSGE